MEYTWKRADGTDVGDIVKMAQDHFEQEVDMIFTTSPHTYAHNMALAVVNQIYNPLSNLVMVARDGTGKLLAYTWAVRGESACWSPDEMVAIRMAHCAMDISARERVKLIKDMLGLWEAWALACGIPIIWSSTVRGDQQGFLKIHEKQGYVVRGSIAYKRIL